MKNKTQTILVSGSLNGEKFCPDPNCPICKLTKKKKNPTEEELLDAFEEAKKKSKDNNTNRQESR
jgi:hypothetical protein